MVSNGYLSQCGHPNQAQQMETALDAIQSPLARERVAATLTLVAIGAPAVPGLLNVLDHPDAGVRAVAARALQGIGAPAVKPLATRLLSHKAHVREAAAGALKNIGDRDAAEALRDLLYRELEDNRYKQRRWRLWKAARLAFFSSMIIWWLLHFHENPVVIFYPLVAGLMASFVDTNARIRRDAVAALSEQDADMIGPLAACLSDNDDSIRRMAAAALQRLLPRVQASDRQHVTLPEMEALLKALGGRDEGLIVAILKALEQVGDERALPAVEGLVVHGRTMDIRRAARDCLPYLQLRADAARQAQTLLRAAQFEPAVAPNVLLRAAITAEQTPNEQLLRSWEAVI
jgi:HEAT repeat protein